MNLDTDELPEGWSAITLGELGLGRTEGISPSDYPNQVFEVWSVPSFPTGVPEHLSGKEIGSNKQRVKPGDVLLCKINPRINRVWVVDPKNEKTQIASTEWVVVRNQHVDSRFLMHRMREGQFREAICAEVSGVGGLLTRARPQVLKDIEISIPPFPEQRRIVAKIEALQARSRKAREALEAIPPLLEQFRQSVLAAAFRGDLTADLREQHPDVEPASVLLDRIRTQRRRLWYETEAAKFDKNGMKPKSDKWKEKYLAPEVLDFKCELQEIPSTWIWTNWDTLTMWVTYGFTRPMPHVDSGPMIVTAKNVRNEGLRLDVVDFTTEEAFAQLNAKDLPQPGDMLIIKDGATTGRVALVPEGLKNFCINQSVGVVWLKYTPMNRTFLLRWIQSPLIQNMIQEAMAGMAMPHLSVTDFRAMPVPIPPIQEQNAICQAMERILKVASEVSDHSATSLAELSVLDQSILAKAFRGELVPQDANDEPASVLLDRIRAERAAAMNGGAARRADARPTNAARRLGVTQRNT